MPEPTLRFIGDVHGYMTEYIAIAQKAPQDLEVASIQVGDVGFYQDYKALKALDNYQHRILAGNHDDYTTNQFGGFANQTPHFLGNFGIYSVPGWGEFFYVRGGASIDYAQRTPGIDWWYDEQLGFRQLSNAVLTYQKLQPEFVVSHECPSSIIPFISKRTHWDGKPIVPSSTADALQAMLEHRPPKVWVFGHHHVDFDRCIDGTKFICLAELSYVDMTNGGEIQSSHAHLF